MTEKKKPTYEPPEALDLSARTATGDISPLGTCASGNVPYTGCNTGTVAGQGPDCNPGADVGTYPQCRGGSYAHSACLGGGAAG